MFATPDEAIKAPQEQYLYVACLHEGTGVDKPDFLAVVGTEPDSPEYRKISWRLRSAWAASTVSRASAAAGR
jgi:selenium-binding protein 1